MKRFLLATCLLVAQGEGRGCFIVNDRDIQCNGLADSQPYEQPLPMYHTIEEMTHLEDFEKFKKLHSRSYKDTQQMIDKYRNFRDNLEYSREFNKMSQGVKLSPFGKFGDHSHLEYIQALYPLKDVSASPSVVQEEHLQIPEVNWEQKGAVGPARDQGQIGSCYAFSSVGAIESRAAIQRGFYEQLSPQQVVDCSMSNDHDDGGLPDRVFEDLKKSFSLARERDYPYTAHYNGRCLSSSGIVNVVEFEDVKPYSVNALKQAIQSGPVSIAVQADSREFQLYSSGVFDSPSCFKGQLDHAVLAIGFKDDYLVVRNSWSSSWGINGNIHIKLDNNNICGILSMASYPSQLSFNTETVPQVFLY